MAVGKTKEGIIYFSTYYVDRNGDKKRKVQQSTKWKTLKDAREAEAAFLDSVQIKNGAMSFSDLFARYMTHQNATKAPSTVRNADLCFREYFQDFHDKTIDQINNAIIEDWQHALLRRGYKNSTIERIQKVLRSVFNYGVKYDLIPKNPFTVPFVRDREQVKEEMRIWTIDEFQRFLNQIDNFIERTMFRTLFFSACRVGELMALTVSDFTGSSLIINKQITKEGLLQPVKNKNGNRVVPLPGGLCDDLRSLVRDYYGGAEGSTEWLFCGLAYGSRKQLEYWKNIYAERAGLKQIRLHDFRHSMVSYLLAENRFTYKEVAQFVGDDVKTIIETYGHVYGDLDTRLRHAMNDLEGAKSRPKVDQDPQSTKSRPKLSPKNLS